MKFYDARIEFLLGIISSKTNITLLDSVKKEIRAGRGTHSFPNRSRLK